jgi:hypothetical protein
VNWAARQRRRRLSHEPIGRGEMDVETIERPGRQRGKGAVDAAERVHRGETTLTG